MNSRKIFTLVLLCLLAKCEVLVSQNVTIRGKAHESYVGKLIKLYTIDDNITNLKSIECYDTIQTDGYFELQFHTLFTKSIQLKIESVTAKMYVEPDYVYGITIPETERALDYKNDAELEVNIGIIGNDSTELNALIFDFQEQYTQLFTTRNGRYLTRQSIFKLADTLQLICNNRYANIQNNYFKNYILYSIASINANVSRGENYLANAYIFNKPIQYHHEEYMQFFNAFFKGYLLVANSSNKKQSLHALINSKANYNQLAALLHQDKFIVTEDLKELVILKNLWEFYFNPEFSGDAISSIISQLSLKTKNESNKLIANNMLAYFNKMQEGSKAPDFSAIAKNGKMASLGAFKGKWIYLNFFATNNTESLREFPKLVSLKKKYGDKIVFVSVCLDDSLKSYNNFIKVNPTYDWNIWFNNSPNLKKTAKEHYYVTGTEAYFLINNLGYLAQSPALSPSKGIEYKWNIIFKIKKKDTKTGIR